MKRGNRREKVPVAVRYAAEKFRRFVKTSRKDGEKLGLLNLHSNSGKVPEQAIQAVPAAEELFGNRIAGIFLYGSATLGGLRPESDIDLLILIRGGMSCDERKTLTNLLLDLSAPPGHAGKRPLEVVVVSLEQITPWRFPPRREFLYGEWLRNRLEAGIWPEPCFDPDLVLLLRQARAHGLALAGEAAVKLIPAVPFREIRSAIRHSLPGLLASLKGDERNVLLTLGRMWFTLEKHEICPKDVAAEWVVPKLPPEFASLLRMAGRAYQGIAADHWEPVTRETTLLAEFMRQQLESLLEHPLPERA